MIVYSLSRSEYINDLSGIGARLAGGRWNSRGLPLIYTSSSRALCTVEVAVHLPLGLLPHDYSLAAIAIPDNISIEELNIKKLPKEWSSLPIHSSSQKIGDRFVLDNKYLILKVPSAVVQGDFNYLINPNHNEIKKIKIKHVESFTFDKRLFTR